MPTMRILNPTARRNTVPRQLAPLPPTVRRLALLDNHSPHFSKLVMALPLALKPLMQAEDIDTYQKERYSSGAPDALLHTLCADYDVVITGLAA